MPPVIQRREATPHPHTANPLGSELLITAVALHKLITTPRAAEVQQGRYSSLPVATYTHKDFV